jgi:hypothetical protein
MGKIKLLKGNNSISIDRITINENFEHIHEDIDTIKSTIANKNVETVSGKVDNESTVPGTTITQALESLKNTVLIPGATGPQGATGTNAFPELIFDYWVVDPIHGDDNTGIKGSRNLPFKTIAGAEYGGTATSFVGATSGDTIIISSDIAEANRGKDGLTYIFENNSTMSYPSTSPAISGLNWNSLWTDQSGTDISYTVIGGRFTIDSYWYGVWRRSVVRLTSASKVVMLDTEHMEIIGDDGWNFYLEGDGCTIDVRASGDIVYAWMLVRVEAPNTTCNVYSKGSIRTNDLGYGSSLIRTDGDGTGTVDCSNTKLNLTAERSITCGGHYVGTMRGGLNCSSSPNDKSTFIINTPLYEEYDRHINRAGDEKGTIAASNQVNHYVQFNADVFKLHHDTSVPSASPYYGGHAGVTSVSSSAGISFVVDMNVGLLILGVGHRLDYSRATASTNKVKAIVNYNNTTIVYTDPSAQTSFYDWKRGSNRYGGSVIDTKFCNFSFNGTTKVIINPLAITAGQVTFGTSDNTEDNAYIVGEFISNGTVKVNTFTDSFTGVNYATGIPKMKLLDSTMLTEYSKYEGLL